MNERKKLINDRLESLQKSKFRSSFHLRKYMIDYIDKVGIETIIMHAYDLFNKNLKYDELRDGKQTPMKGHPVFIAAHATATCCRGCLFKWHGIEKTKDLTKEELNFIVELAVSWIIKEYSINKR